MNWCRYKIALREPDRVTLLLLKYLWLRCSWEKHWEISDEIKYNSDCWIGTNVSEASYDASDCPTAISESSGWGALSRRLFQARNNASEKKQTRCRRRLWKSFSNETMDEVFEKASGPSASFYRLLILTDRRASQRSLSTAFLGFHHKGQVLQNPHGPEAWNNLKVELRGPVRSVMCWVRAMV